MMHRSYSGYYLCLVNRRQMFDSFAMLKKKLRRWDLNPRSRAYEAREIDQTSPRHEVKVIK